MMISLGLIGTACGSSSGKTASSTSGSTAQTAPLKASWPEPQSGNGGATATGVTANSIQLGVMISSSGPLPGATTNQQRGAAAYYAYINSLGGVYGRTLKQTTGDDGFDTSKAQAACAAMIPKVFAIVGSLSSGDAGCYPQVASSGVLWVGDYLDPQFYALPNAFNPGASSSQQIATGPFAIWQKEFPAVKKVAILYENVPGLQAGDLASAKAMTQDGYDVVYNASFSPTDPNLTNYVIRMRDKGAQGVYLYAVDVTAGSRMASTMAQQGWNPPLKVDYSSYNASWHQLAGQGAAGWEAFLSWLPFLDTKALTSHPGGALFLQWFRKLYPKQPLDQFAVSGWSQAQYFVQALIAAGPEPTRAKLIQQLRAIKSFDANGLIAPTDPGDKKLSNCFLEARTTATGYTQTYPSTPNTFECNLGGVVNANS